MNSFYSQSKTAAFGLAFFSTLISISFQQTDKTLEAGSSGRDVALAALRKIQQSSIFGEDDRDFFRRVAYVETRYGTDNATYADGKYGGVWNISEFHFNVTKNTVGYPDLNNLFVKIEQRFGIAWSNVTLPDLHKPLYSALAAKLLISNVPAEIPGTIEQQARFWSDYYNPQGSREKFIFDVRQMENETACKALMDIAIVLDGSASIDPFDFNLAKGFVANLIDTFSSDSDIRTGFIVYSDEPNVVFPVENDLSVEELKGLVRNAEQPQALTYTNTAMLAGVGLLNNASERAGVPQILTVFTDGVSTDGVASGADIARESNITTVAIGIGRSVNNDELLEIALNDTKNVFTLVEFAELEEFYYRLTSRTCEIPVDPSLNVTINDTLSQNQARYFKWEMPPIGITISLKVSVGQAMLYYSYSYENPNSGWNDGEIEVQSEVLVFIPASQQLSIERRWIVALEEETLYVSVIGMAENNSYAIQAVDGNAAPGKSGADSTVYINVITIYLAIILLSVFQIL